MDATEIAHGHLEGADSPYLFIWDIDGTLTQAPGVGRAVMEQVFRELFGIANALEGIPMAGSLDSVIVGTAFDRLGLDRRRLPEYWTRYCARLEEALAADPTARTTPNIEAVLAELDADPRAYNVLGTGNIERGAWIKLRRFGLDRFFEVGGFGDVPQERWRVIETAVRRAEARYGMAFVPERITVIGDTPRDIEAGKRLGVRTVAVATGPYDVDALAACRPDAVLPSFAVEWRPALFGSET
ncbi:MAG: HAD hydrolase-like protein [Calditerricola sp.]|nr:HAD hydrolase-like protein [Calditerricola sp.]